MRVLQYRFYALRVTGRKSLRVVDANLPCGNHFLPGLVRLKRVNPPSLLRCPQSIETDEHDRVLTGQLSGDRNGRKRVGGPFASLVAGKGS